MFVVHKPVSKCISLHKNPSCSTRRKIKMKRMIFFKMLHSFLHWSSPFPAKESAASIQKVLQASSANRQCVFSRTLHIVHELRIKSGHHMASQFNRAILWHWNSIGPSYDVRTQSGCPMSIWPMGLNVMSQECITYRKG